MGTFIWSIIIKHIVLISLFVLLHKGFHFLATLLPCTYDRTCTCLIRRVHGQSLALCPSSSGGLWRLGGGS